MMIGWGVSGILTTAGMITNDPQNIQYKARTDIGHDIITNSSWFYFPYPGKIIS